MADAIAVASLFAELSLVDHLTGGLANAGRQMGRFEGTMSRWGSNLTRVGAGLSTLTAPLMEFGQAGLAAASDFEGVLSQIEIFGGLGEAELNRVSDAALAMGAATMFSSQDAANAMLELTKSGFSVEESMTAARAALDLAAAGGTTMEDAAGAVSTAMSVFNMEAEAAAAIADSFARAAGASRADVPGLVEALENAGPVAAQFGLDLDKTNAVLAVFADNGLEGAEAGTQLKSMLLNMNSDTAAAAFDELGVSLYDATGDIRDFDTVIDELDVALGELPVQEQNRLMQDLAGSFGITGLSALLASGGIDTMIGAMGGAPGAADLAAAAMDTFKGKTDGLSGSVETLMITALTPLMDNVLGPMVEKITEIVNGITDWIGENPELAGTIIPIVAGAVLLVGALVPLGIAFSAISTVVGLVSGALAILFSPVVLIVGAIAALLAVLGSGEGGLAGGLDRAATAAQQLVELGILFLQTKIEELQTTIEGIVGPVVARFQEIQAGVTAALQPLIGFINEIIDGINRITGSSIPQLQTTAAAAGVFAASGVDAVSAAAAAMAGSNSQGRRQHGGSVPRTGMYHLDQNEQVLNSQQARAYRRGGSSGNTYNLTAIGTNPNAALDLLDRARRNRGR